jgi:cytochrome o ubiquinol oxidase subunit 2
MNDRPGFRRSIMALAAATLLSACRSGLLDPAGDIARQQRDIIFVSTALMLLIIVPVIALIILFAWRYRESNEATYDPDFDHSTTLELVIWSAPLLIIICLGALTWGSTHLLDPFRPLDRIAPGKRINRQVKPLVVEVISLDWKWLFLLPDQGIATVNELALPVDTPVRFQMTSSNMMNSFYAPAMAGMIYTMPGMVSQLHAVLNRPGRYEGLSANYSGAGFSDMRFTLLGLDKAGFDRWVAQAKASGKTLDRQGLLTLEKPSEKVAPMAFGHIDKALFDLVANRCEKPGTVCLRAMMAGHTPDPRGGIGKPDGAVLKPADQKGESPNVTSPAHDRNRALS